MLGVIVEEVEQAEDDLTGEGVGGSDLSLAASNSESGMDNAAEECSDRP